MTILNKLIEAVEKIQKEENIESSLLVRELQNTLNHFKLKDINEGRRQFWSEYVDKPWF